MSEQAVDITPDTTEKRTILDYFVLVGSWLLSFISLLIIGLIAYWAIKIPEKNINNLPIINAIKGDIRVEPAEPGGKPFNDEDLSIYKNLENGSKIPEKKEIVVKRVDQNFLNLKKEIKTNELSKSDNKDLNSAIEAAVEAVVSNNVKENNQIETGIGQGILKLYLGSFDTLSQAGEFKQFLKKRNDSLINAYDLKVFEKLEGERKTFRVELINISSKEDGKKLCSILSSRQFSCLLFEE